MNKYFAWLRQITPYVYDNAKSIYEVISELIPLLLEIKEHQDNFSSEMDNHYNKLQEEKQKLEHKIDEYVTNFLNALIVYRNLYNNTKKDITDTIDDIVRRYNLTYQEKLNNIKNIYDTKTQDIEQTIEEIKQEYTTYYGNATNDYDNFIANIKQEIKDFYEQKIEDWSTNWQEKLDSTNFDNRKTEITTLINEFYADLINTINTYAEKTTAEKLKEANYKYVFPYDVSYNGIANWLTRLPNKETIGNVLYKNNGAFYDIRVNNLEFNKQGTTLYTVAVGEELGIYFLGIVENIAYYIGYYYDSFYNNLYCYLFSNEISANPLQDTAKCTLIYDDSLVVDKNSFSGLNFDTNDNRIVQDSENLYFIGLDINNNYNCFRVAKTDIGNNDNSVGIVDNKYMPDLDNEQIFYGIKAGLLGTNDFIVGYNNFSGKEFIKHTNLQDSSVHTEKFDSATFIIGLTKYQDNWYILEKNYYNSLLNFSLYDTLTYDMIKTSNRRGNLNNGLPILHIDNYFSTITYNTLDYHDSIISSGSNKDLKSLTNVIDYSNGIFTTIENDMITFKDVLPIQGTSIYYGGYIINQNGNVYYTDVSGITDTNQNVNFYYQIPPENITINDIANYSIAIDYYNNRLYFRNDVTFVDIKGEIDLKPLVSNGDNFDNELLGYKIDKYLKEHPLDLPVAYYFDPVTNCLTFENKEFSVDEEKIIPFLSLKDLGIDKLIINRNSCNGEYGKNYYAPMFSKGVYERSGQVIVQKFTDTKTLVPLQVENDINIYLLTNTKYNFGGYKLYFSPLGENEISDFIKSLLPFYIYSSTKDESRPQSRYVEISNKTSNGMHVKVANSFGDTSCMLGYYEPKEDEIGKTIELRLTNIQPLFNNGRCYVSITSGEDYWKPRSESYKFQPQESSYTLTYTIRDTIPVFMSITNSIYSTGDKAEFDLTIVTPRNQETLEQKWTRTINEQFPIGKTFISEGGNITLEVINTTDNSVTFRKVEPGSMEGDEEEIKLLDISDYFSDYDFQTKYWDIVTNIDISGIKGTTYINNDPKAGNGNYNFYIDESNFTISSYIRTNASISEYTIQINSWEPRAR